MTTNAPVFDEAAPITALGLTKTFGEHTVVRDLSFSVRPGLVTGFLGPNGAGKSTTMRMILGLDRPSRGTALVGGRPYGRWPAPSRLVGAMLDPAAIHPGRTARAHLAWQAHASGVPATDVDPLLRRVGLGGAMSRRARDLSHGMRQRLGLAAALLGEPRVLILDEPLNGLDPEGIVWLRELLREVADRGGTVLLSSHLMNEMQATADHLIVIIRGRLAADVSAAEFSERATGTVHLAGTGAAGLGPVLTARGAQVSSRPEDPDSLIVSGIDSAEANEIAWHHGVTLRELSSAPASLESSFLALTHERNPLDDRETDS